ncbi:sensor histidine kinase, partial [Petrachloros mirabilis]
RGELALALIMAEERASALLLDRSRLGRQLHNDVLRSLSAVSLSYRNNRRVKSDAASRTVGHGDLLIAQIDRAALNLRQIIQQIESSRVTRFSLVSELRRLVDTYRSISSMTIRLHIRQSAVEFLTQEEEHELLVVAREALSNCVRHAEASRATIALRTRRTKVALTISDDGKGFASSDRRTSGYGLANITERVEKLGWQLHIQSEIGRGTLIRVEYLLEPILSAV